jgi:hypothetical protein
MANKFVPEDLHFPRQILSRRTNNTLRRKVLGSIPERRSMCVSNCGNFYTAFWGFFSYSFYFLRMCMKKFNPVI